MSIAEKVTALQAVAHGRTMKVFVRDLVLPCRIGVYSHEKHADQRVRINLELACHEHPAINDDHRNVVCYAEVVEGIRLLAETTGIFGETAAGVTVAAARALSKQGRLSSDDEVVLCIGHHGKSAIGGQMPLMRRIAKRGFNNNQFAVKVAEVNVAALEAAFDAGASVTSPFDAL